MNKRLLLAALLASTSARADDGALQNCRALADAARRLACYDAIPASVQASAAPPSRAQATAAAAAPVRSSVAGRFDGWGPGTVVTLANGQVWKVSDDSEAVLPVMQDPRVEITRGLLGGYLLQVEGHPNSARVTRLR